MPHMFPILIAKGLSQSFRYQRPPLTDIDLTIHPGQIHVVVGQSGAGKTVLADILAGSANSVGGSMLLDGQLTTLANEQEAAKKGIRYVKQLWDRNSRLSVCDALHFEVIPKRFGLVDTHALKDRAIAVLSTFGLPNIDPSSRICDLPIGDQKLIQIASALSKTASLVILDDPAAALTGVETELLFKSLSRLQYAKTGILYCTASAEEALQVGDQITVLRDGRFISSHDPGSVFVPQIAGEMLGLDLSHNLPRPPRTFGPETAIRVEGLSTERGLNLMSLKAKRGEIVGLLGLQGAGQSEAVRAIGGLLPHTEGEIYLRASGQPSRIKSAEQAVTAGIALIQDPWALAPNAAEKESLALPGHPLRIMNAENPQKAPIAKSLKAGCSVMLFDNPTRGLNIACRLEVYKAILEVADQGITVLAASTNLEELMTLCDRIAVFSNGYIKKTFERADFSADKIQPVLKKP